LAIEFDDLTHMKRAFDHDLPHVIAEILHKQHLDRVPRRPFCSRHSCSYDLRIIHDKKIARLSMIFSWFKEDFVAHSGSLINYVRRYVADPVLARELETTSYKVEFLEYDWRLNGPTPSPEVLGGRPS